MDKGKNIAYIRVSTLEQNEDRQFAALEPKAIDRWFTEKVSGKDTNRPQLQAMLDYVRDGDTLFITDFSRLSRSVSDLLTIMQQLESKGVRLISLKESIDTHTATGKLITTVIAAINEFERDNLLERQREGIACAKAKGVYKGRKQIEKPANWDEVYSKWKRREISGADAMKETGLKRNAFYNFINQEKAEA